jgi:hypothetical protein
MKKPPLSHNQALYVATMQEYAKAGDTPTLVLYNPLDAPIAGMFSAAHPTSLQPGQFPLIQNFRFDDATLQVRQPTINRNATGLPTGSNIGRGLWAGKLDGSQYIVCAVYDGSKVGLYVSTNGVAFSAITASTGAYGDTRLTDTGVPVAFAVIRDPVLEKDYLAVQNGTDYPRVYSPTAANSQFVRIQSPVTAPTSLSDYAPKVAPAAIAVLTSGVTTASTGTTFSGITYGTDFGGGPSFSKFTYAAPMLTDTATISFTAANFSSATQIALAWGTSLGASFDGFRQVFKVEVHDAVGGYTTIYDPTAGSNPTNVGEYANTVPSGSLWQGQYTVVFDISAVTVRTQIDKIRLTVVATSATLPVTRFWLAAIFGGTATGAWNLSDQNASSLIGSSYLAAYMNSGSRGESAGVVLAPIQGGNNSPLWPVLGGQDLTGFSGYYGPNNIEADTYAKLGITVPFPNTTTPQRDLGVDTLNVYRQDLGSSEYLFAFSVSLATWGGASWAFTHTGSDLYYSQDTAGLLGLSISRFGPDAYAQTMPVGSCVIYANSRSFVGQTGASWTSEYNAPWRFRPYLTIQNGVPQERSGSRVQFAGETAIGYASASASVLGASTVFLFTDKRTYSFSGFDGYALARPGSPYAVGCTARGSIQTYKDAIFFLDDQGQQRRFAYNYAGTEEAMRPISRRVVDDITRSIPASRLPFVTSGIYQDRYYMGYTPSGGSENTRALVWDEYVAGYMQDTATSEVAFAVATLSGVVLLLAQGSDGKIYSHEDPASSTAVTVAIQFPELHVRMWDSMFYGRFGVVLDKQGSGSATITKTMRPDGTVDTSAIALSTGTSTVWRWDNRSGAPPGASGVSCLVQYSAPMTPASRIYGAVIERTPGGSGADV